MEWDKISLDRLTEAERRVLQLVALHYTTGEIATQLGLSEHTVKTHIEHILAKLGLESRREAARLWLAVMEEYGARPSEQDG
jgi:DNA-binding CsgD family transcriptional regulator